MANAKGEFTIEGVPVDRQLPLCTIGESEAVPLVVRFRSVRLRGEKTSESRRLEKRRGDYKKSQLAKRPSASDLERKFRGFTRLGGVTTHAPGEGSWPQSAVEIYLADQDSKSADLLEALDGSRTMLWGRIPPHVLSGDAPELPEPITIPFEIAN